MIGCSCQLLRPGSLHSSATSRLSKACRMARSESDSRTDGAMAAGLGASEPVALKEVQSCTPWSAILQPLTIREHMRALNSNLVSYSKHWHHGSKCHIRLKDTALLFRVCVWECYEISASHTCSIVTFELHEIHTMASASRTFIVGGNWKAVRAAPLCSPSFSSGAS